MIAADAGPMGIQWREDAVCRCAGTVQRSRADFGGRGNNGVRAKFRQREKLKTRKEGFCTAARHTETEPAVAGTNIVL